MEILKVENGRYKFKILDTCFVCERLPLCIEKMSKNTGLSQDFFNEFVGKLKKSYELKKQGN